MYKDSQGVRFLPAYLRIREAELGPSTARLCGCTSVYDYLQLLCKTLLMFFTGHRFDDNTPIEETVKWHQPLRNILDY
jgi:hypothetical protein